MTTIGQISHPNKTIDRKVKAFFDYFHYFMSTNEFIILEEQAEENHLSILEKIDFRLQNLKIEKSSKKIIGYLKDNPLLDTKSDFISRKGNYKEQVTNLKTHLQKNLSDNQNVEQAKKSVESAVIALNESYDYQNSKYLDFCLDEVISYISCEHELEEHLGYIKYYTKLIVAEFLRRNFSPSEVTGVNSIFNKILSKEINLSDDGQNVYSLFPLPTEFGTNKETPDKYEATVREFLKNRTLKEQFKGILNYLNNVNKKSLFIVKVLNASSTSINISYGKTRIVSKEHLNVNTDNWETDDKEYFEEFVTTPNCLFFEKELVYKSLNDAAIQIMREAEDTLSYLCYPNSLKGTIDRSEFLYLSNDKLGWNWIRDKLDIKQNKQYWLDAVSSNYVSFTEVFELDKLYYRVFTSVKAEDKIFNAWRYIEILFKEKKYKDKIRIRDFTRLLLSTERAFQDESMGNLIVNLIINNHQVVNCKIPKNKLHEVLQDKESRISTLKKNVDYKFICDLIDDYENPVIDYDEKFSYYEYLTNTIYEQRNYVVHQATICTISLEILIKQIQIALRRVRNELVNAVQNNNDLCLTEIVENLLENIEP